MYNIWPRYLWEIVSLLYLTVSPTSAVLRNYSITNSDWVVWSDFLDSYQLHICFGFFLLFSFCLFSFLSNIKPLDIGGMSLSTFTPVEISFFT